MGFSYAAQVVEVSVDDATGLITIDKVWAALDCGPTITTFIFRVRNVPAALYKALGGGWDAQAAEQGLPATGLSAVGAR